MYKKHLTLVVIQLMLFVYVLGNEIVDTTHGKVRGKRLRTLLKDSEYYGFMGIPFAAPPIKEFKFLPPQPSDPWPGVLDATKEKRPCLQYNTITRRGQSLGVYGKEDCLYLDIFTPSPDSSLRPVIIFLHSEYLRKSYNKTKDYAPDFFIEEDVVIATISHRLSVYGFLSLEDDKLPGNSGLWDIVAGLQWIKDNIARFGGDPSKITLMGSQSGAVAVELLIHSKARILFNSAILQGGSAWYSMYLQGDGKERAKKLAKLLEIINTNNILKELNNKPAKDIFAKELRSLPDDYNKDYQRALLPFGPVVENQPDGLITSYPEHATSLNIPLMVGFNSREGLDKTIEYLIEPRYLLYANKDFVLLLPNRENFRFLPEDSSYDAAVNDIKNFYFKNGKVTPSNAPEYVTYIGDVVTKPINDMVKFYANISTSPIYYYNFDYYSDLNENKNDILKQSQVEEGTWGATSGDELCYLFKCPRLKINYLKHKKVGSEEILILRKMVRMWANFAKYRNPTPDGDIILSALKWPKYSLEHKEYLHIDKNISVKKDLFKERFKFWDDFVDKWKKKAVNGIVSNPRKIDEL